MMFKKISGNIIVSADGSRSADIDFEAEGVTDINDFILDLFGSNLGKALLSQTEGVVSGVALSKEDKVDSPVAIDGSSESTSAQPAVEGAVKGDTPAEAVPDISTDLSSSGEASTPVEADQPNF